MDEQTQQQLLTGGLWILLAVVAVVIAAFVVIRGSLGVKNARVSPLLETRLRQLVAEGHKIKAVKELRGSTGMSLRDAKRHVDQLAASEPLSPAPQRSAAGVQIPADTRDKAIRQLKARNKIGAIKTVKEDTGLGLAEAKKLVEQIEAELRGS
ncbi:MAG: ribosomal protein L7/L12 [Verrucomicrobiota bacterium JB022]|nr:ribosomal protein L7/L12 [Verrucomicrobiota bacterium JB022]